MTTQSEMAMFVELTKKATEIAVQGARDAVYAELTAMHDAAMAEAAKLDKEGADAWDMMQAAIWRFHAGVCVEHAAKFRPAEKGTTDLAVLDA